MVDVCRIGDKSVGVCNAHIDSRNFEGTWTHCSGDVDANGLGIIRVGDTGVTDCGHTIQAIIGSGLVSANGLGVVRVGDPIIVVEGGDGVTTTGSSNVSFG